MFRAFRRCISWRSVAIFSLSGVILASSTASPGRSALSSCERYRAMLSSICASRRCILACVKFRSRALTALNLLPSIATLPVLHSSRPPAQNHHLTADLTDGRPIVLSEVGYRLEIRHQAAGEPNQLDVALAFPLQAPARLHPIEVSIDVNLQQRRWMVGWPSCRLWLDAAKTEFGQIKLIDKDIDRPDRIVLAQIVIQPLGKQSALTAVMPNDKARHRILRPNRRGIISLMTFSHSLDP